ncbi:MAG: lysozyme [Proteobacteria bacterium]|nr:MAG: lysozyme [Pseudomonadota bacterium]
MIPEPLLSLIRKFEGLRLKAYRCPAGVPTIGYGHTGPDVSMDMPPITAPQAEALMHQDADVFYRACGRLSPRLWLEGDAKHAAIADFCFNLGTTRYKASTLKRHVDAGDWQGAAEEMQKWVWGGGRKLPGLIARRAAEARLLA